MNSKKGRWMLAAFFIAAGGMSWVALADTAPFTGRVYLSGAVHKVGAIDLPTGETCTVMKAIILDGGLADSADQQHIKILRKKADGTSQTIEVNLTRILGNDTPSHKVPADLGRDVAVQAGDVIVVPIKLRNY